MNFCTYNTLKTTDILVKQKGILLPFKSYRDCKNYPKHKYKYEKVNEKNVLKAKYLTNRNTRNNSVGATWYRWSHWITLQFK